MKKKTIIVICATLVLAFALCACDSAHVSTPVNNANAGATGNATGSTADPTGTTGTTGTTDNTTTATEDPTQDTTEGPTQDTTENTTTATEEDDSTQQDTPPVPVISDPFLNETSFNNAPMNQVSIQPKYVRWEGDKLIAVCFVVNTTQNTVFNINVTNLSFSGNTGLLAEGAFGICNGLTLAPMTYQEWTFTFNADCIAQYGADLSSLRTVSNTEYNF